MGTERLAAFSDGVIAIIITVMVLELKAPDGATFAALRPVLPVFGAYVLSFLYVGIYWNNHHHLLVAAERVRGAVLWANLHLLFWLSLVPYVTEWLGRNPAAAAPTAVYGMLLLLAAIAFTLLQRALLAVPGQPPTLAAAMGRDGKGKMSLALYAAAIVFAFLHAPWLADLVYAAVALIWLLPDPRIERAIAADAPAPPLDGED